MKNMKLALIMITMIVSGLLCFTNTAHADAFKDPHHQNTHFEKHGFRGFGKWHNQRFNRKHDHKRPHGSCPCTTPEPISMILFLFGSLPLAANLYMKKKGLSV